MTAPIPSPVDAPPAEPAPPAPAAPPAPVPSPPPAPPVDPAAPPAPAPTGEDAETFPRDYVVKLRQEAADRRTAATTAAEQAAAAVAERDAVAAQLAEQRAMLDAILKAAGVKGDEPPDPEALAKQLADEKAQREQERATLTEQHAAQIRALTVKATLPTVLAKAGANVDLTTAVLTSDGTLSKLDPSSPTFAADLESAVGAALEAHPQLKTAPVAARSGAQIPGRSGGSDQLTLEQVKTMKPEDINKARTEGRLKNLGIG